MTTEALELLARAREQESEAEKQRYDLREEERRLWEEEDERLLNRFGFGRVMGHMGAFARVARSLSGGYFDDELEDDLGDDAFDQSAREDKFNHNRLEEAPMNEANGGALDGDDIQVPEEALEEYVMVLRISAAINESQAGELTDTLVEDLCRYHLHKGEAVIDSAVFPKDELIERFKVMVAEPLKVPAGENPDEVAEDEIAEAKADEVVVEEKPKGKAKGKK